MIRFIPFEGVLGTKSQGERAIRCVLKNCAYNSDNCQYGSGKLICQQPTFTDFFSGQH